MLNRTRDVKPWENKSWQTPSTTLWLSSSFFWTQDNLNSNWKRCVLCALSWNHHLRLHSHSIHCVSTSNLMNWLFFLVHIFLIINITWLIDVQANVDGQAAEVGGPQDRRKWTNGGAWRSVFRDQTTHQSGEKW